MKTLSAALLIVLAVTVSSFPVFGAPPFSFEEIRKGELPSGPVSRMKMSDGIDVAYQFQSPQVEPVAVLIFLHGGGAYSGAGYQNLAAGLSRNYRTAVYLPDTRGHGYSGGPRGDTPTVERVWEDLKAFVLEVRKRHPGSPLYLGGHSSGGGLVLNYAAWDKRAEVDGYIFVAPQFGYKSETARNKKDPFAEIRTWVFIASAMTGGRLFGNTEAVRFNYPDAVLKAKPLMLRSITRNMAIALTPQSPQEQFRKLDKPFGLFAGERDELFIAEKIMAYGRYPDKAMDKQSRSAVIPRATHLSILLVIDKEIGRTILEWARDNRRNID